MREIKFRAWDEFYRKFTYSDDNGSDAIDNRLTTFFSIVEGARASSRSVPVMQFTGLKDKNGKECFDSDKVLYKGDVYVVNWGQSCWVLDHSVNDTIRLPVYFKDECEIIGNIYENPELLSS